MKRIIVGLSIVVVALAAGLFFATRPSPQEKLVQVGRDIQMTGSDSEIINVGEMFCASSPNNGGDGLDQVEILETFQNMQEDNPDAVNFILQLYDYCDETSR